MNFIKKHFDQLISIFIVGLIGTYSVIHKSIFLQFVEYPYLWIGAEIILLIIIICCAFLPKKKYLIYSVILFLLAPLLMECAVEMLNGNMLWDIDMFGNVIMNYLINLLFYILLFSLTGSLKASICISSVFLEIFGIANYYVKLYKGGPLLPWDLSAITTATNVAGAFSFKITKECILSITIVICLWKLSNFCIKNQKTRSFHITRGFGAGLFIVISCLFYGTDLVATVFQATPDFFNQTRGYEAKGAIAEFLVNTRYLHLSQPDDYDVSTLEKNLTDSTEDTSTILETALQHSNQIVSSTTTSVTNPNIITIMNESFSDLSVIGDFETTVDYLPFINTLKNEENCISGYSYVSTIGTGTSNTEYEFLTGNTMAFLPIGSNAYQLYVNHTIPSLVSSLESQGYSSQAFHPYYKENWNRINVYDYMGFDSYTGYGDYNDFDKIRLFVSDQSDFEHVEELYENRDTSKPFFLFNVTMQNHSSYDQETGSWFPQVKLKNMDGTYPLTEQYLSLIKETDTAFSNLISYFKNVEEPTIILMYGDHQPYIEDSFYEEVMGKKLSELTDEEQQKRYITRFVLWANYDIPEGWIDEISVNYLSTLLSQVANLELTDYQNYLNTLYTKMPVITMMGCKDWEENYFTVNQSTDYSSLLNIYQQAAYNNLIDSNQMIKQLFYLRKKE